MSQVPPSPVQHLSSLIDDKVACRALHNSVQKLNMFDNASFSSDHVRKEFMERLLTLNHLSHFESYNITKLGDIHRLIYRSNVANTLLYLDLRKLIPDSRASKLFAKHSCFCKIAKLTLGVNFADHLGSSAYFVSSILSSCTDVKELYFFNFNGCGVEPFALENRNRKFAQLNSSSPSTLGVTTMEHRTSMKHLMAIVTKVSSSEAVSLTWACREKIKRLFKSAEKQYWYHIKAQ